MKACSSAAVAFSLFGGFLAGYHLDFEFEKITWIQTPSRFVGEIAKSPTLRPWVRELGLESLLANKKARPHRNAGFQRTEPSLESLDTADLGSRIDYQRPYTEVNTQNLVVANDLSTQIPRPKSKNEESIQITLSSALNEDEQRALTSLLLEQQMERGRPSRQVTPRLRSVLTLAQQTELSKHRADAIVNSIQGDSSAILALNEEQRKVEVVTHDEVITVGSGTCGFGWEHGFHRPMNDPRSEEETRICPTHVSWISKSWNQQGWIQVEGPEHRTTLTMHPAPNGGRTLLMDELSLGAITVRSGIQIAKGMGAILGVVPKGYKVEFTGRSEETEYFNANHKAYFLILNAEPGSGVIELIAEQNQNQNTTLFVPILEDVITYLDLVPPTSKDYTVKVVKNATQNDPDVVGLTVGISTQSGIQAITQSTGIAHLTGVRGVKGYPIFVDVSSKTQETPGYPYRYELKNPDDNGVYVVNEIADASLNHWLRQITRGLSDQGAMVVGAVDRTKIDGFKNLYTARVSPINQKFGLDPINYSILWDGALSETEPLEGDLPRFMAVQVSEGLSQVSISDENKQILHTDLIPVSPRVIHVVSP